MAVNLKQKLRLFSFESPLGTDKLLVNSLRGSEQLDEPFRFDLELVSEDPYLEWDQIAGRNVTVGIRQRDGTSFRYFNGHISRFAPSEHKGRLAYYNAELVPWLWFLTQTRDCVMHQDKTVPEVIEATFNRYGFQQGAYQMNLKGKHEKWDYCVQYRESSFAFVSRLMETEGIYYYFKHENGKHTLVMVDDRRSHVPLPDQPSVRFDRESGSGAYHHQDRVYAARMERAVRATRYTLKEYNYLMPKDPLQFESGQTQDGMRLKLDLEMYDFPGEYETNEEGRDYSDLRQEEQEDDHARIQGASDCRSMSPGFRVSLSEHPREELNTDLLITSVTHTAHEGTLLPGSDAGDSKYENCFEAIPASAQYRPDRDTRRAVVRGSQTAFVVGPKGEEIYTDQLGRVKVQFHWDRKGQRDEKSSCWIRVMQPWAGMGYGQMWIPRVGTEVVVDFLEGDPDRPIITGCLYNEDNRPPWTLPDNKNFGGVKTRSTKGGSPGNFNELRLDDSKGAEQFAMRAEKDMQIAVMNDTTESIARDRFLSVERHQTELVAGDKHSTVRGEGRQSITKDLSIQVGGSLQEKVSGNIVLEAAGEIHIKAGGRIVFESGAGVTFLSSGGGSFVDVTGAGVVAQGPQIWLNCGITSPAGAQASQPLTPILPGTAQWGNGSAAPAVPANSPSASSGLSPQPSADTSPPPGAASTPALNPWIDTNYGADVAQEVDAFNTSNTTGLERK
jgi:type VI secretion system secreted protein VgrG